eukprot:1154898-Pelagomonas_calceolata.AAC.2
MGGGDLLGGGVVVLGARELLGDKGLLGGGAALQQLSAGVQLRAGELLSILELLGVGVLLGTQELLGRSGHLQLLGGAGLVLGGRELLGRGTEEGSTKPRLPAGGDAHPFAAPFSVKAVEQRAAFVGGLPRLDRPCCCCCRRAGRCMSCSLPLLPSVACSPPYAADARAWASPEAFTWLGATLAPLLRGCLLLLVGADARPLSTPVASMLKSAS